MASAEASALELAGPEDLILWLNDDTNLDPSALLTLTSTFESHPSSILVGATRSAGEIEAVTYGGLIRDGIHPLRFRLASVSTKPVPVDSFNGNVVMVPSVVAHELGGIDGRYSHAWADIDYGLRATQQGREVLQVPGTVGVCERNPPQPHDTFRASWRQFRSKKGGGEPHSLRRIVAVARPRTWWVFVAWTNLSFALKWVIRDLRERTQGG
jgi:GT2 family glycosyltransferase